MASHEQGHHNAGMWVFPDPRQAASDLAGKMQSLPAIWLLAAGVLSILGVIGFIIRASSDGFGSTGPWGYYAGAFSFIFMVTGAAPLAACAFRFTKSHWRRPVSRVSELFALVGVLNVILFIPLLLAYPAILNPEIGHGELEYRRTLWFQVPIGAGAPQWLDLLAFIFLALTSVAILWLSALPDMAQIRAGSTGFRRSLYGFLAGHWFGAKRQWLIQKAGLAILGAFYFMMLIFVQFIFVTDFAMSMVPGWKDSILPPQYTVMSFQSTLGLILIILFIMRRKGGYQEYIGISPFWSASKILLGVTLLWTYHLFAFFITYWYGRLEVEQNIIKYLFVESYLWIFVPGLFFSFVVTFLLLIWNPVRRSDWGPPLAGASALLGAFLFNIRTFVGAFNAGDGSTIYQLGLTQPLPATDFPDLWDIFIVVGLLGLAALVYLIGTKLLPLVSLWETKEGAQYQHMDTLFKGEYLVLAKPE